MIPVLEANLAIDAKLQQFDSRQAAQRDVGVYLLPISPVRVRRIPSLVECFAGHDPIDRPVISVEIFPRKDQAVAAKQQDVPVSGVAILLARHQVVGVP